MNGGDAIVESIARNGVSTVFGVPGESYLDVLDALHNSSVRFISCRHEGGASFMASGYGKVSGEVAVCFGTRAVGASNLAIGIHTARQDSTPMIAIAGQVRRDTRTREGFQELNLTTVFAEYCKWAIEIDSAERVPELMARAFAVARSGRPGPVFVSLPEDMLADPVTTPFPELVALAGPMPDERSLVDVLKRLLGAKRPLIIAGGGVLASPQADRWLREFAEAVEVPVITTWRRHDAFPVDHRLGLGSASLGQPPSVWSRIAAADVILAVGTRFQEITTQGYTVPTADTYVAQIDIDASSLSLAIPVSVGIVSDAGAALKSLVKLLPGRVPGLVRRRADNAADRAVFEAETALPPVEISDAGVNHAVVIGELQKAMPRDGVVVSDAGNFYAWLSRYYRFPGRGTYVGPTSGAMGYGLPAAIGAKIASPGSTVVCVSGDGGFTMTLQEIETAVRYGVRVVALVLDNQRHGTIRMHQERRFPGRIEGTKLGPVDFAGIARSFGAEAWSVTTNQQFAPALRAALHSNKPAVVHVQVDPHELSVRDRLRGDGA